MINLNHKKTLQRMRKIEFKKNKIKNNWKKYQKI